MNYVMGVLPSLLLANNPPTNTCVSQTSFPANSNFKFKKMSETVNKALASKLAVAAAKKYQYVLASSTLPNYCVSKSMNKDEINEFLPNFFKFLQEKGIKGLYPDFRSR